MNNRRWVLSSHPEGPASVDTWRLVESAIPTPEARQILIRTRWLSLDPYMRSRISREANYTAGVAIGSTMHGGGVGEVIASNHPDWQVGDLVEAMNVGWQEYAVLTPELPGVDHVNKVDPLIAPPEAALSWLGMPGLTAYIGMLEIGRPKPGDTVVVSAASGAVGQIAGQIAKLMGARVVAIASTEEKLDYCRSIGFAEGLNHRSVVDMTAALKHVCPDGIHVFFDNTGGPIHDAAMLNLSVGARVVVCGRIAVVDKKASDDIGLRASGRLIVTRAMVQGLNAFDWWHRRDEAVSRLAAWHRSGAIQFKQDVLDGFERVPEAFVRMMSGTNFGKQLVRL